MPLGARSRATAAFGPTSSVSCRPTPGPRWTSCARGSSRPLPRLDPPAGAPASLVRGPDAGLDQIRTGRAVRNDLRARVAGAATGSHRARVSHAGLGQRAPARRRQPGGRVRPGCAATGSRAGTCALQAAASSTDRRRRTASSWPVSPGSLQAALTRLHEEPAVVLAEPLENRPKHGDSRLRTGADDRCSSDLPRPGTRTRGRTPRWRGTADPGDADGFRRRIFRTDASYGGGYDSPVRPRACGTISPPPSRPPTDWSSNPTGRWFRSGSTAF